MSDQQHLKSLSKFLALVLRHQPHAFDLQLDAQGFAPVEQVWGAIVARYGTHYTMHDVQAVVDGDQYGKKRYEIEGDHIRALYGHSHIREIEYQPCIPPAILYHGTHAKAVAIIRETGLQAMGRQYVHLTTNHHNAIRVAKRRTPNPYLLTIDAIAAHQAGVIFYHAEAEHYLTRQLPPQFINFDNGSSQSLR